jgi:hypothetical protein
MQAFRKVRGRFVAVDVSSEELGRVAGDNDIWVWYGPKGPEVVFREKPVEVEEPEEE